MHNAERATGKDIILDIVENMRAYREELLYSSVVPTSFEVHLHADDYARLEGIFPAIAAEARRALDEELARLNRRAAPGWLQKLTGPVTPAAPAQDTWSVAFYRDENDELRPGDVLIDSRLTLPQSSELSAGTRTRRITTSRIGQQVSTTSEIIEVPPLPVSATPPAPAVPAAPAAASAAAAVSSTGETTRTAAPVFATLTYEDKSGRHTHAFTGTQLVIGRGGAGYWVDMRIDGAQDISREHVRLRRDQATGQFYVKDVSLYGTTVNGQRIASSIDTSSGAKQDLEIEVALPPIARIGLADMVFVDFRMADAS